MKELKKGEGESRIVACMKDDKQLPAYKEAIAYMTRYRKIINTGLEEKKAERKLIAVWGKFADFISELLKHGVE